MGAPCGFRAVPWQMLGKKPAPQFCAYPLGSPRPSVSYMTTNAGRFWLSLPNPYVTQLPMHGKPMRVMPVLILSRAEEWWFESVQHEWRNAILSTCRAMCGKMSETYLPDCPC